VAGTAGGHALVGAFRPGSYQVTPTTPRFSAAEDETPESQPAWATDALWVTPPSEPRLPDRGQESRGGKSDTKMRLFDQPEKVGCERVALTNGQPSSPVSQTARPIDKGHPRPK
jgi:hypothetical protein